MNVKTLLTIMQKKVILLSITALLVTAIQAFGQGTFTVSGKVYDSDGTSLPGANVIEKGTTNGTATDYDGNYSLTVSSENATLIISFVGYISEEVSISGRSTIDVTLTPDLASLQEIVVVGYGTAKKSDLTGAVGSIKAEDLIAFPTANLNQALQGRIAGVQVRSANGTPGAAPKITIRGINSPFSGSDPLFVVDGFVGGAVPPAEDIASIDILKDASATAIYGSRGANGVVMITTKSGSAGEPKIEVNYSFSPQEVINTLDLLNRDQYVDMLGEIRPDIVFDPNDRTDTDWQDEIYRTGYISNTVVSVSGGSDKAKYYVSGGYFDQKGLVISSDFDRMTFNSKFSLEAKEWLNFSASVFGRRTRSNGIVSQERTGGPIFQGAISSANLFAPTQPVFNDDGSTSLQLGDNPFNNPVAVANERVDERTNDRLQINLKADLDIADWLKFTSTFGYSVNNSFRGRYIPSTLVAGEPGGAADINTGRNTNLLTENYFTFDKSFSGSNNLKFVAGFSYQDRINTSVLTRGEDFISNNFTFWNLSNATLLEIPASNFAQRELLSYYGRMEYNYDSRYFLTGTLRYDGSSILSEGNKYDLFPSVALAWNLSRESFMTNVDFVDLLKLRVSYGEVGNESIPPYRTLALLETNSYTDENNNLVTALNPGQIPNSDLEWERSKQLNVGLDADLFQGGLTVSANYYKINTTNLLFEVDLNPLAGGNGSQFRNLGEIENRGIELALGTTQEFGQVTWNSSFNISTNENEVISVPEGEFFYTAVPDHISGLSIRDPSAVLIEGQPMGQFWGYIYDGVYQEGDEFLVGDGFDREPGGERFRDIASGRDENNNIILTPNDTLDGNDRTVIGDPNPDFLFGFDNTFSYKGFDLNIFFQGAVGGDIYNFTRMELDLINGPSNATTDALNRWTPTNTNTDVPAARDGRQGRMSSRFVEDGSYVRLKNIALGYNLPSAVISKWGLSRLRFYVSAQNILTITDYKGLDPEVSYRIDDASDDAASANLGLDYASYPNPKSYTVGVNLTF